MHILFVHKNYPAQFGHIAAALARETGFRCSFVSETGGGEIDGIQKIQYRPGGGATRQTHYCSRTFENAIWHAAGVYEALKPLAPQMTPDLIVGHSGFGSTLFLPELFPGTPIINYFEYFYRSRNSDLDFRPEWPALEYDRLRSRARNAMILLDLETCQAGYTPTQYQKSLFPDAYQNKLEVIHDGIDVQRWRPQPGTRREAGGELFSEQIRIVTYVSRGLEAMRGFDLFMRTARRIYETYPQVVFFVVGSDQVAYGGDLKRISTKTFKEYVLSQEAYDMQHFRFLGQVPAAELARLFSLSDLHIYLTVPFVLSWSLLNAMACGCTILASETPPVVEFIRNGANGLLEGFFDVESLAQTAVDVLKDPRAYRATLGVNARQTILDQYSLEVTLPRLKAFCNRIASARNL